MTIISNIKKQKRVEDVMKKVSSELFGTDDYKSILDVMAPSDYLVKQFWSNVKLYVPYNIKISDYM